jgi:hypothetical protein
MNTARRVLIVAYVSIANHMKPYFIFFSATGTLGEQ